MMNLEFKRFRQEYFDEYAAWFADPELNRRLGPMDHDWLDAVLAEPETAGCTWAVFRDGQFVAVIETCFSPGLPVGIRALAVNPVLRRQGIGSEILNDIRRRHHHLGFTHHVAYVSRNNEAARRCFEKAGFMPVTGIANEHGYLEMGREVAE